jgi:nicotinate phosphoribosyltransferase
MTASTALLTDHYELTMVAAARQAGIAGHRAVFEVFARRLPPGRRYGVVAGTGRLLDALAAFRFGRSELESLQRARVVDGTTLGWLAGFRFSGDVTGYEEGELYLPGSPVLTVEAPFAEAVLLETLLLSVLNHDAAIAAAGARMVSAARGRALLEFGGRRTHEEAAVAAARAAYIVGFAATSNLEAGRRYGIPTSGTSAHAFTLAFPTEAEAFAAQVASLGAGTTLLVDTYDVEAGIRTAVEVAGPGLGAVRIDSGDLGTEVRRARRLLDELGATGTRIVVSGDLDEYAIEALADAPADSYGVGTRLVTGSGAPTGEFVYKAVAVADGDGPDAPLRSVEKAGGAKATHGGRKRAHRALDDTGTAVAEVVLVGEGERPPDAARALQHVFVRDGEVVRPTDLAAAREHHVAAMAELPPEGRLLTPGPPFVPTELR